jgi:transcriptional regulator with XRE-family HTH domain
MTTKRSSTIHDTRYRQLIEALIELRTTNGISQSQLAAVIGIGQPEISKVETFIRRLDILEFFDWVRALSELSNADNSDVLNGLYSNIYRPR